MWFVLGALRRPVTVIVAMLAIAFGAYLALKKAPADIFPKLGVPVVYVVQPYGGMSPVQMETQLINYYEYHFLYLNGIEHIESESIQGIGIVKLYFHPGTDIAQSLSQVSAMSFRALAFMPAGTLPPFIVRFDAGSVPVGQLVFASESRSESEIQDQALFQVRPILGTIQGVSAPPPSGGKVRMVVVYVDPEKLRSYRVSPDDVANAIAHANLTLPNGSLRTGDLTRIATTNAMVGKPAELETVPIKTGVGPAVYVRDVARVVDDADVVSNVALVNGRRTVYLPITKTADASTLDVVNALKAALPKMRAAIPRDIEIRFEFDQSPYVTNSIRGLLFEGLLGAGLTALVVLLFLRSVRSALIVVVTIPMSILAALVALRLTGQTVNIMTLSGLALAVGILVDESTVAIENIHTHLAKGKPPGRAVVDAMHEVMQPRFLAMLCVLAVFIPSFFMVGISASLFPPLALAVGFAMVASYLLSSTLVPVLSARILRGAHVHRSDEHSFLGRALSRYGRFVELAIKARWLVLFAYVGLCAASLLLLGRIGTQLFPDVDTGQFQLRIRAKPGTRLENTEQLVLGVDKAIRDQVGPEHVQITLANIGNPAWTYPVNALYVFNAGPQEAVLLASLTKGGRPKMHDLQESLRDKLNQQFPEVSFSFEAGDIVSQVLNFGAATAVELNISGKKLSDVRGQAQKVLDALKKLPSLRDVQIPQALDYPTIDVNIDRQLAGQLGVTVDRVARSVVSATFSSALTTPIFWTDSTTGVAYRVAVRVPENQLQDGQKLLTLPVMADGSPRPLLGDVATISNGSTPGQVSHYNSQRTVRVIANIAGSDLGAATRDVENALKNVGAAPRGVSTTVRGQVEQMRTTLDGLKTGLGLSVVVVLLLLAANFQSFREPIVALSTAPAVLAGVSSALFLTGTTLNVQSLMGTIMSIGVSVANAVLLVTFARDAWISGKTQSAAAVVAATSRLRPILMTSVAMIAGMVPMALGVGEGGEQSAPLARAVIGGLFFSTFATLAVLPAIYVLVGRRGPAKSASLAPDDVPTSNASDGHAAIGQPAEAAS
jgi:multidrug efflux pump subunit AcrB